MVPSRTALNKAASVVSKAVREDHAKNYAEAFRLYTQSLEYFMHALRYEPSNENERKILRVKITEYLGRAEQLKKHLRGTRGSRMPERMNGEGDSRVVKSNNPEINKLMAQLEGAIVTERLNVKWSDVAGLEAAKEALKEAVIMPKLFPELFTGSVKPWKGILLFGPPGTGKSYLAKAVATEARESIMISVSGSDLVSKWLGESEKLVRSLFELARKLKPAIIFIDEIDSLASSRSENEAEPTKRIKTELLIQMQGVNNNNDDVLVLAATNIPWALDPAIRRRFQKRIYIPLPDAAARTALFEIHVGTVKHTLTKDDFKALGRMSKDYSGDDISVVVADALLQPIKKVQAATHFKKVSGPSRMECTVIANDLFTPCSSCSRGAIKMTFMDVPKNKLLPPVLTMADMQLCFNKSKPSVDASDIKKYRQFMDKFGQAG
ncbi:vacuolar protein sorting-associated protein 4B-like isoform X2 [Varroa jacobsoni]|nr:vacuolar protein sorting-associated protein 4B-like isoform X2 [Varroa jacobsoni]XP_022707681.1 vacuolar protein sorting-associated protein 4B-like isoform X2 [Varroa jacobsoni]XP_022707682.1 vacuolar protein sorting-associated protein 4B-like isoform X2 [Varroa jacobsoni]XP_022707683.1 vacuolar protein sorting-associated protein 4B-like isoform X2 [Varroa jacobsoni]XP_022707684.1 vacuolar protein sorting-associated protein 4B-like isoform X2 [Varroa jacobsoni]XP_022707686.1 vacuolar protei